MTSFITDMSCFSYDDSVHLMRKTLHRAHLAREEDGSSSRRSSDGDARGALEGLTVEIEKDLRGFFELAKRGFEDLESDADRLAAIFGSDRIAPGRIVTLVARLHGEPVGTTLLHLSESNPRRGGIYWVSVLPSFRNRGIASALMGHSDRILSQRDREEVVLQATPSSCNLYANCGYVTVGLLESWIVR